MDEQKEIHRHELNGWSVLKKKLSWNIFIDLASINWLIVSFQISTKEIHIIISRARPTIICELSPDFAKSGGNKKKFNGANLIFILWGKSGIIKFEFKTISVS